MGSLLMSYREGQMCMILDQLLQQKTSKTVLIESNRNSPSIAQVAALGIIEFKILLKVF